MGYHMAECKSRHSQYPTLPWRSGHYRYVSTVPFFCGDFHFLHSIGSATRVCYYDGIWEEVDVFSCQSRAIVLVLQEVKRHKTGLALIDIIMQWDLRLLAIFHCKYISLAHFSIFLLQARDRLPGANEVIEEVTPELLESVAVVSEQLAMATDMAEGRGLLPLDLEATNDIVAQVGYNILAT